MAYDGTDYGIQYNDLPFNAKVVCTVQYGFHVHDLRGEREKRSSKKITFEWIKRIISSHLCSCFFRIIFKSSAVPYIHTYTAIRRISA